MMKLEEVLAAYDREMRIKIEYPGSRREQRPFVIRQVNERGGPHFILYSALEGADVQAVIAEEQAYFGPLGEVEWKVYAHDKPADLQQQLAARGFEIGEEEAVMALALEETVEMAVPMLAEGVTVRRLATPAELPDVRQVEEAVWQEEMAWITENLAADMARPDFLSVYVAYVDKRPASAGWIYFHDNGLFADLWGGSTLAEQRGKGLYTAVLAARVQEAAARGYRYVTIDASPMSRPIVARHGFQLLTRAWACTWERKVQATD